MTAATYGVVVVSYRSSDQVERLLTSLPAQVRVTVVDNAADEEPVSARALARPGTDYVVADGNVGFAVAANIGARRLTEPVIIFVNPDCLPSPAVLDSLAAYLCEHGDVAAVGPALVDEAGHRALGGGGWQPTPLRCLVHAVGAHRVGPLQGIWMGPHGSDTLDVEWLAGTCLAVRRDAFLAAGGFDERFWLYQEDMALGLRLQRDGHRQVYRGDLSVPHVGGGSSAVDPVWLWTVRGSALAGYITLLHRRPVAWLERAVLTAGWLLRSAAYAARGSERSREMRAYAFASFAPSTARTRAQRRLGNGQQREGPRHA